MAPIKTGPALQQAITSTYLYDFVIALVVVLALVVIANAIPWEGGRNDRSGAKRRVWYFTLIIVSIAGSLLFDYFLFFRNIRVPAFTGKYLMHMAMASIASGAIYAVVSFVIIKMSKVGSKLESIFPKKDK